MSPITKASGTKQVVLARYARNRRLGDALFLQAYSALRASPGARAFYDRQRARGATHYQALEPARRHPARLPAASNRLRRAPRMAHWASPRIVEDFS